MPRKPKKPASGQGRLAEAVRKAATKEKDPATRRWLRMLLAGDRDRKGQPPPDTR